MISNLYKDKSSEIDLFGTLQLASPRFAMLDCLLQVISFTVPFHFNNLLSFRLIDF